MEDKMNENFQENQLQRKGICVEIPVTEESLMSATTQIKKIVKKNDIYLNNGSIPQ